MAQPYVKSQLLLQAEKFLLAIPNLIFPEFLAIHYPHVLNRVYLLWGNHASIKEYFNSLVLMTNQQQGFKKEAFQEIIYLQEFYENIFPEYNEMIESKYSKTHNVWDINEYKYKK